jgi:hypothetical protein
MISKNVIMISMKTQGGEIMDSATQEDIRETALNLDEIYKVSPESYSYIKGFIHCLLQKPKAPYLISKQGAASRAEGGGEYAPPRPERKKTEFVF